MEFPGVLFFCTLADKARDACEALADDVIGRDLEPLSSLPSFDTQGESEVAALGRACAGTGEHAKVSFGSEAALFHNANIATIICGPGHIEQAHQPNEWITVEQLARCEQFMRRLADRVCID